MADFKIQHGEVTILNATTQHTALVAGTDYDVPNGDAFVRITAILVGSHGTENSDFNGPGQHNWVFIVDPTDLSNSLQFKRIGTNGQLKVQFEIIEYVGIAGGENEFKVRWFDNLFLNSGLSETNKSTGTIATIATEADVCPVICAQGLAVSAAVSRAIMAPYLHVPSVVNTGGNISVEVDRYGSGDATDDSRVSVAVIEFTGTNWTVEEVSHTYTAAATNETETLTNTLGALTRGFIMGVYTQSSDNNSDMQAKSDSVFISSTSQVTFNRRELDGVLDDCYAWVISNSQTGAGEMDVSTRVTDGVRTGDIYTDPDVWTETITTLSVGLDETSVMGISGGNDTNGAADSHLLQMGFRLTSTTQITISRGRDVKTRVYTYEILEWPTIQSGSQLQSNFISSSNLINTPSIQGDLIVYPAGVPTCVQRGSFVNNPVDTVLRPNLPGPPLTRNRHTGKLCSEQWNIQMSSAQYDILLEWYYNTVKKVLPFTFTDPVSQEVKDYYFASPPDARHIGGDQLIVTYDLDMTL